MKRHFSKMIIAALAVLFTCSSVFAASAKVTYVKGKVEVSRGTEWVALKVGDVVNEAETISTGFQSEARLNYNGSVMAVPALSRVTLESLQSSGAKDTVSIKVDTGAVRSKVTHTSGKKIEYEARTSVGVASVRGTDFVVYSDGTAEVYEGAIVYYDANDYVPPKDTGSEEGEGEEEGEETEETEGTEGTDEAGAEGETEGSGQDQGPANATTSADEITSNSPKGARVIGAGQSSQINEDGEASDPFDEAKNRNQKAKNSVGSASDKDGQSSGATAANGGSSSGSQSTPQTGNIEIKITFPQ